MAERSRFWNRALEVNRPFYAPDYDVEEVQRPSSRTQLAITPIATPNRLGVWFDAFDKNSLIRADGQPVQADGDKVAIMLDKSGNGRHVYQSDPAMQAIWYADVGDGYPGLWCHGDVFYSEATGNTFPSWVDDQGQNTLVIDVIPRSNTEANAQYIVAPNQGNGPVVAINILTGPNATMRVQGAPADINATTNDDAGDLKINAPQVLSMIDAVDRLEGFINGYSNGATTYTSAPRNMDPANYFMFGLVGTLWNFVGHFRGLVHYAGLLSPADHKAAINHFANRRGDDASSQSVKWTCSYTTCFKNDQGTIPVTADGDLVYCIRDDTTGLILANQMYGSVIFRDGGGKPYLQSDASSGLFPSAQTPGLVDAFGQLSVAVACVFDTTANGSQPMNFGWGTGLMGLTTNGGAVKFDAYNDAVQDSDWSLPITAGNKVVVSGLIRADEPNLEVFLDGASDGPSPITHTPLNNRSTTGPAMFGHNGRVYGWRASRGLWSPSHHAAVIAELQALYTAAGNPLYLGSSSRAARYLGSRSDAQLYLGSAHSSVF